MTRRKKSIETRAHLTPAQARELAEIARHPEGLSGGTATELRLRRALERTGLAEARWSDRAIVGTNVVLPGYRWHLTEQGIRHAETSGMEIPPTGGSLPRPPDIPKKPESELPTPPFLAKRLAAALKRMIEAASDNPEPWDAVVRHREILVDARKALIEAEEIFAGGTHPTVRNVAIEARARRMAIEAGLDPDDLVHDIPPSPHDGPDHATVPAWYRFREAAAKLLEESRDRRGRRSKES